MESCLTNMHAHDSRSRIAQLATPLAIGAVRVPNRVFLAPMSGVSDRPFRAIASAFGAGLVISEMVASELLVRGDSEATMRAERAGEGPHAIQLAGRDAHWMAEGAWAATDAGADIVDINMGCPAKKVTGGYSGSALMRDLDHALRLIEATVAATPLPVTLKMRLGWDERSLNCVELARRAEQAGVRLVAVHGRTRCQFYTGVADWTAIRAVKEAVNIPVIANGDLVAASRLETMLELSRADGVMIGRGSYGRPWFPGHVAEYAASGQMKSPPASVALAELVACHYEAILEQYGPIFGVRAARKHLGWYLDHAGVERGLRAAILTDTRPREVMRLFSAAVLGAEEKEERRAA
jgi:tRNA-dihydrouridine synthase B